MYKRKLCPRGLQEAHSKGRSFAVVPTLGLQLAFPFTQLQRQGSREMPKQEGPLAMLILVFCFFFAFKNETNMEKRTRGELVC